MELTGLDVGPCEGPRDGATLGDAVGLAVSQTFPSPIHPSGQSHV